MSRKNSRSTESYLSDARAIADLFPSLKKYRRRKRLKPQEKAAIQRAVNIVDIVGRPSMATPIKERPSQYRSYRYPAQRIKKDAAYIKEASQLAKIGFKNFKKYRGRKKLTPSQKAAITRAKKKSRHLSDLEVLPEREAKKLRHKIRFPVPGLDAVKLLNVPAPTKDNEIRRRLRAMNYGLGVSVDFPNGNRRFYKFVYTGADTDAIVEAAADLLAEGAKSVHVWLNHGMAGEGHSNLDRFAAMLGEEEAIRAVSERTGIGQSKLVSGGYAVLIDNDRMRTDEGKSEMAEIPWIWGVVGIFEKGRKSRKTPHPDYKRR